MYLKKTKIKKVFKKFQKVSKSFKKVSKSYIFNLKIKYYKYIYNEQILL
tara:strand:+ start:103 stop:249 length:147 start_codon:yes stop_codon:yes gene_type:complete